MKCTDAFVCPYPAGDSSIRRMALEARELGFDSLVAIDTPPGECHGVTVRRGVVVDSAGADEAIARAKRAAREGSVVFIQARDNAFNRAVLGAKGIHILSGLHAADRHAFDHVAARIAGDNGVALDISLEPLQRQRGIARQKALNRYFDIVMLARRFEIPLILSTHARSVLEMRSVREIAGTASLLGLNTAESEQALGTIGRLLQPEEPVREVP